MDKEKKAAAVLHYVFTMAFPMFPLFMRNWWPYSLGQISTVNVITSQFSGIPTKAVLAVVTGDPSCGEGEMETEVTVSILYCILFLR